MQRSFLWLSALLALYVSNFACATNTPATDRHSPHIALLLPLKSAVFGAAAEAARQGFQVASDREIQRPGGLPVRVYGCFDESTDIAAMYRQAIAEGARAVVGPLTRSGVERLQRDRIYRFPLWL